MRACSACMALSAVILLLCAVNLAAQAPDRLWARTFGGAGENYGYSVQQTGDGGYVITRADLTTFLDRVIVLVTK